MPYLQKSEVFYSDLQDKKYSNTLAYILKMHSRSFEESIYPHDAIIYPSIPNSLC